MVLSEAVGTGIYLISTSLVRVDHRRHLPIRILSALRVQIDALMETEISTDVGDQNKESSVNALELERSE